MLRLLPVVFLMGIFVFAALGAGLEPPKSASQPVQASEKQKQKVDEDPSPDVDLRYLVPQLSIEQP